MYKTNKRCLYSFVLILSMLVYLFMAPIVSAQDAVPSVTESEPAQINQLDLPNPDNSSEDPSTVTDNNALPENAESGETAIPTITPEPTATIEPAILKQQAIQNGSVFPAVAPESLTDSDLVSALSYDSLDQISQLSSSHPYLPNTSSIIKFTLTGAVQLRIRFDSDFNLEYGYDLFAIYQSDTQTNTFKLLENKTFSGTDLAGQEIEIVGDTVFFRFETDSSVEAYGWQVADIQAEFPEPAGTAPENIDPSAGASEIDPTSESSSETSSTETVPQLPNESSNVVTGSATPEIEILETRETAAPTATVPAVPTDTVTPTATETTIPTVAPSATQNGSKSIAPDVYEIGLNDPDLPDEPAGTLDRSLSAPKILKIWQTTGHINGQTKPVLAVQITPVAGILDYRMAYSFISPTSGYKITSNIRPNNSVFKFSFTENATVYIKIAAVQNNVIGPFSNVVGGQINIRKPVISNPTVVNSTHVKLSWSTVPGATGYRVWRSETSPSYGFTWAVNVVNLTSIVTTAPSTTNPIYYKVAAIAGNMIGPMSNTVSVKLPAKPKLNPITMTSTQNLARVSWTPVPGATGYRVWRSETAATHGYTWSVNVGNVTAIATTVSPWKTYYYKVAALYGTTLGTLSDPISIVNIPFAVINEIKTASDTQLRVSWDPIPGATGYRIWRSESGPISGYNWVLNAGSNTEITMEVTPGKPYYFKVAPLKGSTVGKLSAPVEGIAMGTSCIFIKNKDSNGVNLYWNTVKGVTGYRFWYREHQWEEYWQYLDLPNDQINYFDRDYDYYFQPENIYSQYDVQVSALFGDRVGPRCNNMQSFMINEITERAVLMDFGMCQNTTAWTNHQLASFGNTLRNTNAGYIPQFSGVYGPFCPTESGWQAPFNQIGQPDRNDLTLIYISGFGKLQNDDALFEIGVNDFVDGLGFIQRLEANGYMGGKMHIIVSSFTNQEPNYVWTFDFIEKLREGYYADYVAAMVSESPHGSQDWIAYFLQNGISSNGKLCPIETTWEPWNGHLFFWRAFSALHKIFNQPGFTDIEISFDEPHNYGSLLDLPLFMCSSN